MDKEKKLKKLKNKKKDIITLGSSSININKNNKLEKILTQPLSSKLPNNKNIIYDKFIFEQSRENIILISKIIFQIEILFSYTNKIDIKVCNLISPLISKTHFENIREERDARNICSNFLCSNKIERNRNFSLNYNPKKKVFDEDSNFNYFCSEKCYDEYNKFLSLSISNYNYLLLFTLDSIYLFSILYEYFEENIYLKKIGEIADEMIHSFKKNNIKDINDINDFLDLERIKYSKILIDNFDELYEEVKKEINI